jgi:uncharacterized protein (DUF2141 family)
MMRLFFLSFFLLGAYHCSGQGSTEDLETIRPTLSPVDVSQLIAKVSGKQNKKDEKTYSITITVTHIRSKKGVIRLKFYDDATRFPHDTGFLRIIVPKDEIVNGTFTVTYTGFTSKNMAVALSDDENNNVELDMGWFFPKEGHAFSDYYHTAFRRPVYEDFDFFLEGDKKIVMKMRYY